WRRYGLPITQLSHRVPLHLAVYLHGFWLQSGIEYLVHLIGQIQSFLFGDTERYRVSFLDQLGHIFVANHFFSPSVANRLLYGIAGFDGIDTIAENVWIKKLILAEKIQRTLCYWGSREDQPILGQFPQTVEAFALLCSGRFDPLALVTNDHVWFPLG